MTITLRAGRPPAQYSLSPIGDVAREWVERDFRIRTGAS